MEIRIQDFEQKYNQMYFFDNNIWMFLFSPIANFEKGKQITISKFLQVLKSNNSSIALNSLVLSEFSNSNLRIDFNLWKEETKNFTASYKKDYLQSSRYRNTIIVISNCINKIIELSERFTDNFNSIDTNNIINYLADMDFNDAYYLELCSKNNWILVSADGDFKKVNPTITILKP